MKVANKNVIFPTYFLLSKRVNLFVFLYILAFLYNIKLSFYKNFSNSFPYIIHNYIIKRRMKNVEYWQKTYKN